MQKIIIVEGKTDKEKLQTILKEEVIIVCTYGTLSQEKLEDLILPYQEDEVYILVDADVPGNKLRKQLKLELPNAMNLYTRKMYREVATTPTVYLAEMLDEAHFEIHEEYLQLIELEKKQEKKLKH